MTGAPSSAGRPSRELPVTAYAALLVTYVALGLTLKVAVLNWIVGPLFPVLVLYVLPRLVRQASRLRRR